MVDQWVLAFCHLQSFYQYTYYLYQLIFPLSKNIDLVKYYY